jgi:hypothetical protein
MIGAKIGVGYAGNIRKNKEKTSSVVPGLFFEKKRAASQRGSFHSGVVQLARSARLGWGGVSTSCGSCHSLPSTFWKQRFGTMSTPAFASVS